MVMTGVMLMLTISCKKDFQVNPFPATVCYYQPIVNTVETSNITRNSAVSGGEIISAGSSAVTAQGICWSDDGTVPTTSGAHVADSSGSKNFNITMKGLKPKTYYIVRAYATNYYGTGYGTGMSFTTQ